MSVVTLDQVKDHVRVERADTSEDVLLGGYMLAAASHIESTYGLVAEQREQSFAFDRFGRMLTIPARPVDLASVIIAYVDPAGIDQQLAGARAIVIDGWARVLPPAGTAFPQAACEPGAIRVTASVGFADDLSIDPCAGALGTAMLAIVGAQYEDREAAKEPDMVQLLLSGFSRGRS